MFLIFFAVFFLIINVVLWKWANGVLLGSSQGISMYDTCYDTTLVKGTLRGILGNIESMKMLEEKRAFLNRKNSMF